MKINYLHFYTSKLFYNISGRLEQNKEEGPKLCYSKLYYNGFRIIFIMRTQQTYSLTTILNQQTIRPQLYRQILDQIKSPLEQIAINVTNDNSIDFDPPPKRPNIPPPPNKSPINLMNHNFSGTYESLSMTLNQSPAKTRQNFNDHVIESILSPLDQQINKKQLAKYNQQLKQSKYEYKPFCGGAFESILEGDRQLQIEVPVRSKSYKRKPIFEHTLKINSNLRPTKTIQQAVAILKQVKQPQLAAFLQLLNQLSRELLFLSKYKEKLYNYLDIIYEKLSENTQYLPEEIHDAQSTSRVLRRLKSKNTAQVLAKVLKRKKVNSQADAAIEQLFSCLNKIEQIISRYLKQKPNAVECLSETFSFLDHNFKRQATLHDQIKHFLDSLEINLCLQNLNLIWHKSEQKLLSRQQFIECVTLNDLIVRGDKGFEQDLSLKGFTRNE